MTDPRGFWDRLDDEGRAIVREISRAERFEPDDELYTEGKPASSVIVIVEGWIKISNVTGERTSLQALRSVGDLVGESAVSGSPAVSTVTAATDVRALVIPAEAFEDLLATSAKARRALLLTLRDRIVEADQRCLRFGGATVGQRLAFLMIWMVDRGGTVPLAKRQPLVPSLTQEELAQLVRAARPTVEAILRQWREREFVETARRTTVLTNIGKLRSIAGRA
ncbi:Crp/Fnr family transcriptional regulator [Spirillospora sp. NPDC047279]|uniref:Crp/Fnr family transcriptional regulator n=1 Tax=Spirillospora sp. NPDC047279 TaxID=3155478 RepID=UPI0033E76548